MSELETGPDRFVICHIAINGQHAHDALDSIENEWTAARERIAALEKIIGVDDINRKGLLSVGEKLISLEAERDSLRKLAGKLVELVQPGAYGNMEWVRKRDAALLSAQKAGIANPSAS